MLRVSDQLDCSELIRGEISWDFLPALVWQIETVRAWEMLGKSWTNS